MSPLIKMVAEQFAVELFDAWLMDVQNRHITPKPAQVLLLDKIRDLIDVVSPRAVPPPPPVA